VIDLVGDGLDWGVTTIPRSTPEVGIVRLHVDPPSGASQSLVRFPPGWSRPRRGRYPVGEEFVVLTGRLRVSSISYRAGHYGWIPPGGFRHDSATPSGALALAWFSGPPVWEDAEAGAPLGPSVRAPLDTMLVGRDGVPLRGGGPGDTYGRTILLPAAPSRVDTTTALLWVDGWHWHLAVPGEPVPARPGRVLARTARSTQEDP
jgi:hypothetical protein